MNLQMRARLKAIRFDRNAFQITAIYLLIGGLWILFSDRFAEAIARNEQMLTTVSTFKGWFYVLVTGLLLYWLIHRSNSRIQRDAAELQVLEKNYKEIFDHATVGIYRSTPDGPLLAANPKLASMFGYNSPEEMLASISDIGEQVYKDSTRREEYRRTITEQGFINDFVNEERRKDGSWIWTSTSARVVKDEAGNILYYEGFSRDVTESKHAEEQLRESEQRFSKIFHASPIGINIFRFSDYRCQNVNDAFLEMTGYSREELVGHSAAELNLFANPEIRQVWMKRLNEGQGVQNQDARMRRKSGELREMLASIDLIDINGETMALVIMSDITERKLSEEKLLASETQYRRLFESAKDGILILDADTGEIMDVNPFLKDLLGHSQPELLGKQLWEIGLFKDIMANKAAFLKLQKEGYVRYENLPLEARNGQPIWVEFVSNVYDVGKRRVVQCNIRDITKRKRAEQALNESEKHFHSLFDHMLEGYAYCEMIYENDRPSDFIYLEVNDAFEKLTGITKAMGRKVSEIIPGIRESNLELLEIYGKAARTGKSTKFETYIDELKIWFSISVYSVEKDHFVAVFDNITERKRTEKSIVESNRQLKALVTSLDDIVFEVDAQGTYLDVWTADENLLAQPKAELIRKQIKDTLQEETAHSIMQSIGQVLKNNDVEEIEYPLMLPSGRHWFLAHQPN